MICNRCNNSLRGNEYQTHWKVCIKGNGKRLRKSLRMKPEHLEARKIKKENKLNNPNIKSKVKTSVANSFHSKKSLKNEIKRLNAIIRKHDETRKSLKVADRKLHPVYDSIQWKELRYKTLRKYGFKCLACKSTDKEIHVDHIKPISKYPELTFDINNLQVLCKDCNLSKSNKFEDDLRNKLTNY